MEWGQMGVEVDKLYDEKGWKRLEVVGGGWKGLEVVGGDWKGLWRLEQVGGG